MRGGGGAFGAITTLVAICGGACAATGVGCSVTLVQHVNAVAIAIAITTGTRIIASSQHCDAKLITRYSFGE